MTLIQYGWNLIMSQYILDWVVTRMDTPKYGETLKFMYIKYQPILVSPTKGLPSLIMV